MLDAARSLLPDTGRVLLGVTGAPGAGKSALAERLVAALGPATTVVPMDGFHLRAAQLRARGFADVKGAPETFDRARYGALLRRLRGLGDVVRAPGFDRAREEVVPAAIAVDPEVRLVVTEGNYLLHWPEVASLLDHVWFVEAADDMQRVESLIARHVTFGRSPEAAREWVLRSDEANARLVAAGRPRADRVVSLW